LGARAGNASSLGENVICVGHKEPITGGVAPAMGSRARRTTTAAHTMTTMSTAAASPIARRGGRTSPAPAAIGVDSSRWTGTSHR
jgi:hypothetical protein